MRFRHLPRYLFGPTSRCRVVIAAHKLHGPNAIYRCSLDPESAARSFEVAERHGIRVAHCQALSPGLLRKPRRQAVAMPSIEEMRDRLWAQIQQRIEGVSLNGPAPDRSATKQSEHLHFGDSSEPLVNALSAADVCVSSGSACGKASSVRPSTQSDVRIKARFCAHSGRFNSKSQMDTAVEHLARLSTEGSISMTASIQNPQPEQVRSSLPVWASSSSRDETREFRGDWSRTCVLPCELSSIVFSHSHPRTGLCGRPQPTHARALEICTNTPD